MGAGRYRYACEWRQVSQGTPDEYGEKLPTHTSAGTVWCDIEEPTSSQESAMSDRRATVRAVIRVRNHTALKAGDTLTDGYGDVWKVEACHRGNNEMVADCVKHDGVQR